MGGELLLGGGGSTAAGEVSTEGDFKGASPVTVPAGHSVWEDPQEWSLNFPAHPDSLADSARWPKERLPWLSRPSGTPNCPRSIPIWLRSIRLSHQMSEPPAFRRVPLCSRFHWFSTPANDAWARNNAWAAYNANLR